MLKEQARELFAFGEMEASRSKGAIHTLKDIWETVAASFPASRFIVNTPDENTLRITLRLTPEQKKPTASLIEPLKFAQPRIEILDDGNKQFAVYSSDLGVIEKETSPEAVMTYLGELFKRNTPEAAPTAKLSAKPLSFKKAVAGARL
jgi:hypothetical protein